LRQEKVTDLARNLLDKLANNSFFEQHRIVFVGGTALSYYLNHRISEDLDFICLSKLPIHSIEAFAKTLNGAFIKDSKASVFKIQNGVDIKNFHMRYMIDDVKVEFFHPQRQIVLDILQNEATLQKLDNSTINIADLKTIAKLKIQASFDRSKIRDMYDLITIIKNNIFTAKEVFEVLIEYTDKNKIELIEEYKK
jgi:predicted nucleotidyltransferase component of viral defense system